MYFSIAEQSLHLPWRPAESGACDDHHSRLYGITQLHCLGWLSSHDGCCIDQFSVSQGEAEEIQDSTWEHLGAIRYPHMESKFALNVKQASIRHVEHTFSPSPNISQTPPVARFGISTTSISSSPAVPCPPSVPASSSVAFRSFARVSSAISAS